MIRSFFILLYLFLFFLLSPLFWGITALVERQDKAKADRMNLRIVQCSFRIILFLSGVKLDVRGEELVPKNEPVLYIGNHRSYFDVIITYARCPGLTGYVAKDALLKVPILRVWMKKLYCLFLNRGDIREGLKMVLSGVEQIKNGISVCIFPEGTRTTGELETDMLPFKEGSMKMAEKTGCAIVPMALVHTADIFEKHFPAIHSTHVILTYGAPIYPKDLDREQRKHLGAYTQDIIRGMLEDELRPDKDDPK